MRDCGRRCSSRVLAQSYWYRSSPGPLRSCACVRSTKPRNRGRPKALPRRWPDSVVLRLGRRAGQRDYATVGRDVLDQKFHLVRENLPIGEDQVLRLVRHIGCVEKLQSRFFRHAVALDSVARPARRDHVHPRVGAAARYRPDMVPRQPQEAESPAAIRADMAVAAKKLAVVERWYLIEALHRHRLALDRDDRTRGDAGAPAGRPGDTAVENELLLAQRPCDQVLCIVKARLLPGNPAVGHTVIVECQNQRNFTRHTKFSITRAGRGSPLFKTLVRTIVC